MKEITKTQKLSLVAIALLACVSAGYVLLYKHIGVMRNELEEVEQEVRLEQQLEENRLATEVLLSETKEERGELQGYFVPREDPTEFLSLVEASAHEAGVLSEIDALDEISGGKGEDGSGETTKKVRMVMLVEGEWEKVYHFLMLLENIPFALTVTNATFTEDSKETGGFWSGQVQVEYSTK